MKENIFDFDRYRAKKKLFLRYFFKGYFPLFCELTSGSESKFTPKNVYHICILPSTTLAIAIKLLSVLALYYC